MMQDKKVKSMVLSALFAALCCVSAMVLQIPASMGGYVNLSDGFVLLAGWLLGRWYGAAAAGIGCMLADAITGYLVYAPGTLVIKALTALTAALLQETLHKAMPRRFTLSHLLSGLLGEAVMVLGYFGYGLLLFGSFAAAASTVLGNMTQGVLGIAVAVIIANILQKNKLTERIG